MLRSLGIRIDCPVFTKLPVSITAPAFYPGKVDKHDYSYVWWDFLGALLHEAAALGVNVERSGDLAMPDCRCYYPLHVNGNSVLLDLSDYPHLCDIRTYVHVFKKCCLPSHEHELKISGWLPQIASDLDGYLRLLAGPKIDRPEARINLRDQTMVDPQRPRLGMRRQYVKQVVAERFAGLVDTDPRHQAVYWDAIEQSLVTVHVGGAYNSMIDRTTMQTMAFGRCLVQPYLTGFVGDEMPHPDEHYIPCNHDFSDLLSRLRWCLDHRQECLDIGRRARALFLRTCSPRAIWTRVLRCVEEGC